MFKLFRFFFFIAIVFLNGSCSSDDDSIRLTPPDWLIGTWDNTDAESLHHTFTISNNKLLLKFDTVVIDYYEEILKNPENFRILESTNDTWHITIYSSTSGLYFSKVSNSEMSEIGSGAFSMRE